MRFLNKTRRALAIAVLIAAAVMIVYGAFFQKVRVTPGPSAAPEAEYTLQGMELFSKARADALSRENGKLIDKLAPQPVVDDSTQPAVADAQLGSGQTDMNAGSATQASGDTRPSTADAGQPETRCPT